MTNNEARKNVESGMTNKGQGIPFSWLKRDSFVICHLSFGFPSLPRIKRIHLRRAVLVTDVGFVNQFELLDGFLLFAPPFQHAAERINKFLLFVVERQLFLDGVLQRAGGEVVHAAASEALPKVTHSLDSPVRIVLGLLKLGNRLADLACLEVKLA